MKLFPSALVFTLIAFKSLVANGQTPRLILPVGHTSTPEVYFLNKGKQILSSDGEKTMVWDVQSGKVINPLDTIGEIRYREQFYPYLVLHTESNGKYYKHIFRTDKLQFVRRIEEEEINNDRLIANQNHLYKIGFPFTHDLISGKTIQFNQSLDDWTYQEAFFKNYLVCVFDQYIKFYDITSGTEVKSFILHKSRDRKKYSCNLAGQDPSNGLLGFTAGEFLYTLDTKSWRWKDTVQLGNYFYKVNRKGNLIISRPDSNSNLLLTTLDATTKSFKSIPYPFYIRSAEFSKDSILLLQDSLGHLMKLNLNSFQSTILAKNCKSFSLSPDSNNVCIYATNKVQVLNISSGKELVTAPLWSNVSWNPDNSVECVISYPNGSIQLFNLKTNSQKIFEKRSSPITSFAFSPGDRSVMIGTENGTVATIEIITGKIQSVFKAHRGQVKLCSFNLDGNRAVTLGSEDTLKLWDQNTGQLLFSVKTGKKLKALTFDTSSNFIVGIYELYFRPDIGAVRKAVVWSAKTGDSLYATDSFFKDIVTPELQTEYDQSLNPTRKLLLIPSSSGDTEFDSVRKRSCFSFKTPLGRMVLPSRQLSSDGVCAFNFIDGDLFSQNGLFPSIWEDAKDIFGPQVRYFSYGGRHIPVF